MVTVPTGHVVCKSNPQVVDWANSIALILRTETFHANGASVVMVASRLMELFQLNEDGYLEVQVTRRHLAALTGLSSPTCERALHWMVQQRLLVNKHSASMRSRCDASVWVPLVSDRAKRTSQIAREAKKLNPFLIFTPPYLSSNRGALPSWHERENAPVLDLCDPRHNNWHGHRNAWLLYVTILGAGRVCSIGELCEVTGLSRHGADHEFDYLISLGILTETKGGQWKDRLLKANFKLVHEVQQMHKAGVDYLKNLLVRIRNERLIHLRWIAGGCITANRRSAKWKADNLAFAALIAKRAGATP